LPMIVYTLWYVLNTVIKMNLQTPTVKEEIWHYSSQHICICHNLATALFQSTRHNIVMPERRDREPEEMSAVRLWHGKHVRRCWVSIPC
jgi:hypothetical protein